MEQAKPTDLLQDVHHVISGNSDDKEFQIESILTKHNTTVSNIKNFDPAFTSAIEFYQKEKNAASARHLGNLGKRLDHRIGDTIDALGTFLTDESVNEDVRRTATVELGSIAKKLNENLTIYDTQMDQSPNVANLTNAFSLLQQGVFPQAARSIGPLVMDTKSPAVTSEGLKILLQTDDGESAEYLDKILDTKEGYVLQKLKALTEAIVETGPENISPEITKSISDYLLDIAPHVENRLNKDIEEIGLMTKSFRVLSKHGLYSEDVALEKRKLFHSLNKVISTMEPDQSDDPEVI